MIVVGVFKGDASTQYVARMHAVCDADAGLCDGGGRFDESAIEAVRDAMRGVSRGAVQDMRASVADARKGVLELKSLAGEVADLIGGLMPRRGQDR